MLEKADPLARERLLECGYFSPTRIRSLRVFGVGVRGAPRLLVCIDGSCRIVHGAVGYPLGKGQVMLLPATLGPCMCAPSVGPVSLLEIAWPDNAMAS